MRRYIYIYNVYIHPTSILVAHISAFFFAEVNPNPSQIHWQGGTMEIGTESKPFVHRVRALKGSGRSRETMVLRSP